MRRRRTRGAAAWGRLTISVLLAMQLSCAALPPNSFLDPTKVGRFGFDAQEVGIRRVLTPRDTPPGLANATDPTPEDIVATFEDYRLMQGDTIALTIQDLITPGQPFNVALQVSPLGEIRIPDLGSIRVAGMTEQEVEQELTARLRDAGLLARPVVIVATQLKRGRTFTAMGAVGQAGTYPIPDSDTRLLDALGAIGDVSAVSKKLYVIRRARGADASANEMETPAAPAHGEHELVVPPPSEPAPASFATNTGRGARAAEPPASNAAPTKSELADMMAPARQSQTSTSRNAPADKPPFGPIIFDPQTGQVLEPERTAPPVAEKKPSETVPSTEPSKLEEPFEWDKVADSEFDQRVIAISVDELKGGNPRYNVVIRDRDVINVPTDTGVFYMMGEVARPGVYAFGGRDITIKQALAVAGGFGQLAWPQRTEIIRREPGTDKQLTIPVNVDAIFAGLDDDLYLRDDDIVNVGTHFVAPFLFVIRNSFRFTYGFGFVYDRNFADKDAYGSKVNPQILDQQRRQQRGLPF